MTNTHDKILKMFNVVPVEQIKIKDRARFGVGDASEFELLKDSISKRGQMKPVLVEYENDDIFLVDGFRRLTALKELEVPEVIIRQYSDLDELDTLIMELEANLHENFTWDEKCKLNKKIHEAHVKKFGKAKRGQKNSGWTVEDTANMLGVTKGSISQDIRLANDLELFPEISKLNSKKQALKTSSRMEEVAILTELARRDAEKSKATGNTTGKPYFLYHGKSEEIIADKIEDETIDLVIFDPPWGIDVHKNASSRGPRGEKTSYADDTYDTAFELIGKLLPELYRVMKVDAHMYMFCGIQDAQLWYHMLTGFETVNDFLNSIAVLFPLQAVHIEKLKDFFADYYKTVKHRLHVELVPLIWVKEGGGYTDFENKYMPRYETILFCSKGQKKPLNEACSNVFEYKRPATIHRIHTQEKPVDLIQRLIKLSTQENEIVLDPCAGSFATAEAATLSRRRSVCIDADETCYAKGVDRMSKIILELEKGVVDAE